MFVLPILFLVSVTRAALNAFTLIILIIAAQQLVCNVFTLGYMNKLGIDFDLPHNVLVVAWSAVQLIGCIVAYLTVESFGRKVGFVFIKNESLRKLIYVYASLYRKCWWFHYSELQLVLLCLLYFCNCTFLNSAF